MTYTAPRALTLKKSPRPSGGVVMVAYDSKDEIHYHATLFLTHRKEAADKTRENDYAAIQQLECIITLLDWGNSMGGFLDRVMFHGGATDEELSIINELFRFQGAKLSELASAKLESEANGVAPIEGRTASVSRLLKILQKHRSTRSTEFTRKLSLIRYLKFLMSDGDAILAKRYRYDEGDRMRRREARDMIERKIQVPKREKKHAPRFEGASFALLDEYFTSEPDFIELTPKSPKSAIRNQAMLMLQFYAGLRRSEVLSLKYDDITFPNGQYRNGVIRVEDRRNDPEDPRANPPEAKTGSRVTNMDSEYAWEILREWLLLRKRTLPKIQKERGLLNGPRVNNFIFTTLQCEPLSMNSYNAAFSIVARAIGFEHPFSTHALRHISCINFVKTQREGQMLQGRSVDLEEIRKFMRERFGWSLQSAMPDHYTNSQQQEWAKEAFLKLEQNKGSFLKLIEEDNV